MASSESATWLIKDFTVDFFIRFDQTDEFQTFVGQWDDLYDRWEMGKKGTADGHHLYMQFVSSTATGANYEMSDAWSPDLGRWYHIAFERISDRGYIFIDGVEQELDEIQAFSGGDLGNVAAALDLGHRAAGGNFVNGRLDELRVTHGYARWTGDFAPPEHPFELEACQPPYQPSPTPAPTVFPTTSPAAGSPTPTPATGSPTATPPSVTVTPTSTPMASPTTGHPTLTPTAPPTPPASMTPTPTIPPGHSPTPTLSPTATPCSLGIDLEMPDTFFCEGKICWLNAEICNDDDDPLCNTPIVVLLDIGVGEYWFYPSWIKYPPDIDYYVPAGCWPAGLSSMPIISNFTWPATGVTESAGPLYFYSALLDPQITTILGRLGSWEFSYGPCP